MNENESQILSIVDRIYEYDGAFYKVNQEYYQKAVNYMMQDDVDLSKDDVVRVQNEMYSYIESAVVQGYLLPVEDVEQEIDKKENSENEIKKETQIPRNEESMNGEDRKSVV